MLQIVPCNISDAKEYVAQLHRHHRPPVGGLFSLAVANGDGKVCGVAIVGRPIARRSDDGWTAEVTRVATDGTRNACSILYGAAWRAARALGYKQLITYTLPEEGGASLRGAGWTCLGKAGNGRGWSVPSRPRVDKHPTQIKMKWAVNA